MEHFTVNEKDVEFDPFDLDVMEGYLAGVNRVDGERRVKPEGETPIGTLRRVCNAILDFFDDQLGEGKAEELFGQRVNAKAIFEGFKEFTGQVNDCIRDYSKALSTTQTAPVVSLNRAQRRQQGRRNQ